MATIVGIVNQIQGNILIKLADGETRLLAVGDTIGSDDVLFGIDSAQSNKVSLNNGAEIELVYGEQWSLDNENEGSVAQSILARPNTEADTVLTNQQLGEQQERAVNDQRSEESESFLDLIDANEEEIDPEEEALREGHSTFPILRIRIEVEEGEFSFRSIRELDPDTRFVLRDAQGFSAFGTSDDLLPLRNNFSALAFDSSFESFRLAFERLLSREFPPSLSGLQGIGVTGLNNNNIEGVQNNVGNNQDTIDTLKRLQAIADAAIAAQGRITSAADRNDASLSTISLNDYQIIGVSGINQNNQNVFNSILNSGPVTGASINSVTLMQQAVDAFAVVERLADAVENSTEVLTVSQSQKLGLIEIDSTAKSQLLSSALDVKSPSQVDTYAKIEAISSAASLVIENAAGEGEVTLEALSLLGVDGATEQSLAAIIQLIEQQVDNGSTVNSVLELQQVVSQAILLHTQALQKLADAAQDNSATDLDPNANDYLLAGVKSVDNSNLAAINSLLNSQPITGEQADTTLEVQGLVDAYNKVLAAADGQADGDPQLSISEYASIGLPEVDTAAEQGLLGDVIDVKQLSEVDSHAQLKVLAQAVSAVTQASSSQLPTKAQLEQLGIPGLTEQNLRFAQQAIIEHGSPIGSLTELQSIIAQALAIASNALQQLRDAAENSSATQDTPAADVYQDAGVDNVSTTNLAAINSSLNLASPSQTFSAEQIQLRVDSYNLLLAGADGNADNDTALSIQDYLNIGVTGIDTGTEQSLLATVLDVKNTADVDHISEVQAIADAAQSVINAAAGIGNPSMEELELLGLTGVTPSMLKVIVKAITDTPDDGSGVSSVDDLQAIIDGAISAANAALAELATAAENDSATAISPALSVYQALAIEEVTSANLASFNSVLNNLSAANLSTIDKAYGFASSYQKILTAADGVDDDDPGLSLQDYQNLAISNIDEASEQSLLVDVLDIKNTVEIDSASELLSLTDAVDKLMQNAQGIGEVSQLELERLSITGILPVNMPAIHNAIAATNSDGSDINTLLKLQTLIDDTLISSNQALLLIRDAAENNSATSSTPSVVSYINAGVDNVNLANVAAINSALNSQSVDGDLADSPAEIQIIVDGYNQILAAADGIDDDDSKPEQADYEAIGVINVDSAVEESLLGDVIDIKSISDIDTTAQVQDLADAVQAVMDAAAGATNIPTKAQLENLALTGVTDDNLVAIQNAIQGSIDNGSEVASLNDLQALISAAVNASANAVSIIETAAQNDTADNSTPSTSVYIDAGVSGVSAVNLAAINSALNTLAVNGEVVDTVAEIQALVDSYNAVLEAADGLDDNDQKPTQGDYSNIGVSGVDSNVKQSLLGDVIDIKDAIDVDSVGEIQNLASAVAAVMDAASGTTGVPTRAQLESLSISGVSDDNLKAIQNAIQGSLDDGSEVATLVDLQAIVSTAALNAANALDTIEDAAQNNTATNTTPSIDDYTDAGVSGVSSANLAALNSALNSAAVNGAAVDSSAEVQSLVESYETILAAADGLDDNDANPTQGDYSRVGVAGVDTSEEQSLLGDVIDIKTVADIDSIPEIQALADAVQAVMNSAAGASGVPSKAQLESLTITGVTDDNLRVVQNAIQNSADDGSEVDNLSELQTLVNVIAAQVTAALDKIQIAAENNSATTTSPAESDYIDAGVSGVDSANLATINSALNSALVDGAAVDTAAEVQALVDSYRAILEAADGNDDDDANPVQADYARIGIIGVDSDEKQSLLGDVIDIKTTADVDTLAEVQTLATAVQGVMDAANGTLGVPSKAQLDNLGISGVTDDNLIAIQNAIQSTADDGSEVDTLSALQTLVTSTANEVATALNVIQLAAENNTATNTSPSESEYTDIGVSGVNGVNLASINSALNSMTVNGAAVDSSAEVQSLVDSYETILAAADGLDDNDANPTQADYTRIGVTGVDSNEEQSLLGDVIDIKTATDVDTISEIQSLADAAQAVMDAAAGNSGTPSKAQLESLGINGVTDDNLIALQNAIQSTVDDGSEVDTLSALQALITSTIAEVTAALNTIQNAAENNNATNITPSESDYTNAGVSGVNAVNLAAINSALNTTAVDGLAVDTVGEVQALVNSYATLLNAADGSDDNDANPTQTDYARIGVTGVDTNEEQSLLGDVIDVKSAVDVDTISEVQALADAVQAVMDAASGNTATPSKAQLESLGITGVTDDNLIAVQNAIQGTANDGTDVDTLAELQALITTTATAVTNALNVIQTAAENNTATGISPSENDYTDAGVSGVNAANLAAINSALNSVVVDGAAVDTAAEAQALVNSYSAILDAADGIDDNDVNPTQADYARIGVTGVNTNEERRLLGDVIDVKSAVDVDTIPEVQALASAVQAVMDAANGNTGTPGKAQLDSLEITGVTDDNLAAVQNAIQGTNNDGTDVDTLVELQALITTTATAVTNALNVIQTAAENNTATNSTPSESDYTDAGVSGVNAGNLAAINSALNSTAVNGAAVDTAAEVQDLVNSYGAILAAADGSDDNDTNPTQADYARIGVTGVDTNEEQSLLGDVIDVKNAGDVDTIPEVQALAGAVQAVMDAASGNTATPSKAQLESLGITGVTDDNLIAVQNAIQGTANDGSAVDTLSELQALITATATAVTNALNVIQTAAENNSATNSTPTESDYTDTGVSGVNAANLAAINSALNSDNVNGVAVDTVAEIQALVNSYGAILAAADGSDDNDANPTQTDYARIGVTGVDTNEEQSLLGDVIDVKNAGDVDTISEVQALATAVQAVMDAAAGTSNTPSKAQLESLGITDVTDDNLIAVQNAIQATNADGSEVDTIAELQALVTTTAGEVSTALDAIKAAALGNSANDSSPSAAVYSAGGVSNVDASNLAALNSALNTASVNDVSVDSIGKIQTLVNSYNTILAAADGSANNAADPSQQDYLNIGVTGLNTAGELALAGDLIDSLARTAVDRAAKIQLLSGAVQAVMDGASGTSNTPSKAQLENLGITDVTDDNLIAVQNAIQATNVNGSEVDTIAELQALVTTTAGEVSTALDAIKAAALGNSANDSSPSAAVYSAGGVSNVDASNLAALNSALNTASVNDVSVDSIGKIQTLVNSFNTILAAADGSANNAADPSQQDYLNIGVTGLNTAGELALAGDLIDSLARTAVDRAAKIQLLSGAVQAVMDGASGTSNTPSKAQLENLGITDVTDDNLIAVQNAIQATNVNGSEVDTIAELQALVTTTAGEVSTALDAIKAAALGNSANDSSPSAAVYSTGGVSNVDASNLAALNSALNTTSVNDVSVDSIGKIQILVNSYNTILAVADGSANNAADPSQQDYLNIGVTGLNTAGELALAGDLIDSLARTAVDRAVKIQLLSDAVQAVMDGAAGSTATPSKAQLETLGITGVTDDNLIAVQNAIQATNNNGTEVDTLAELQALVSTTATEVTTAVNKIKSAADNNDAIATSPSVQDYTNAGVSDVESANLAAINSALNTALVDGDAVDSVAKIQTLVNSYESILNAADGIGGNAPDPTLVDYTNIGVIGVNTAVEGNLLGDVIDAKNTVDVDTTGKIQALGIAVQAVMDAAGGTTDTPSKAQLESLGIIGVTDANLTIMQNAIRGTANDGSGVDTLSELQALITTTANTVIVAINKIKDSAESNNATATSPNVQDYLDATISGVNNGNLSSINSALNTALVDGAATDTAAEIQALVSSYATILNAADGNDDNDTNPLQADYSRIGVTGIDTSQEQSLLGDVIDIQSNADVDTVAEVQALANAVQAVMNAASGALGVPSKAELELLGITGVTDPNMDALQTLLRNTLDDGSELDTLLKLQTKIDSLGQAPETTGEVIKFTESTGEGVAQATEFEAHGGLVGRQLTSQVTEFEDGSYVVTSQGEATAFWQKYDAVGVAVGPEVSVSGSQLYTHTAVLNDGTVIVTSGTYDGTSNFRHYDSDGSPLSPLIPLPNNGTASIASLHALSNGGFAVTTDSFGIAIPKKLFVNRYDKDGVLENTAEINPTIDAPNIHVSEPSVIELDNGDLRVVWVEQDSNINRSTIYTNTFDSNGNSGTLEVLRTGVLEHPYVKLDLLDDGGYAVTWIDGFIANPPAYHVYTQIYNEDGSARTAAVQVDDIGLLGTTSYGQVISTAVLEDGNIVIAWMEVVDGGDFFTVGDVNLLVRVMAPDGTPVSDPIPVHADTLGERASPNLEAMPDGSFIVTWANYTSVTSSGDIKVRRFDGDGSEYTGLRDRIDEDTTVTVDVLANDSDPQGDTLSVTKINGQAAASGEVITILDTDGLTVIGQAQIVASKLVFTPGNELDKLAAGESKIIAIEYSVSDGTFETVATASLNVAGANDAPVITVINDTLVSGQPNYVVANIQDIDNGSDLIQSTFSAVNGTVAIAANGDVVYTPNLGFSGADTLTINAIDNNDVQTQQIIPITLSLDSDGDGVLNVDDLDDDNDGILDVDEQGSDVGDNAYNIASAQLSSSHSVASEHSVPSGISFNTDGTKMFIVGQGTSVMHQYSLTSPFDIASATVEKTLNIGAYSTSLTKVVFSDDGTKMFLNSYGDKEIEEFELATPFDIGSVTHIRTVGTAGFDPTVTDAIFNEDGTKLFLLEFQSSVITQFSLPVPYSLEVMNIEVPSLSIGAEESSPHGMSFNHDGSMLFVIGHGSEEVNAYQLNTPYDVSAGASHVGVFDVGAQEGQPSDLAFNNDGTQMYVVGFNADSVITYDIDKGVVTNDIDGDGIINSLDLDSDNDGIADNIEAQSTAGYIAPSGTDADNDGLDDAYDANTSDQSAAASIGLIAVNTDGDGLADYKDTNSDNDDKLDSVESGLAAVSDATYDDVNGSLNNPAAQLNDTNSGGEVDYRDATVTPLILDLDGDGVETLSKDAGTNFDIDADGYFDLTGWVGKDDALLVWDKNGNGVIDDASELFGEHSINADGRKAGDGFAALSDLDTNNDGVFDKKDSTYSQLQLWQDENSDAVSQASELVSLQAAGVASIDLNHQQVSEQNNGNWSGLRSSWSDAEGEQHIIDDVWFSYQSGAGDEANPANSTSLLFEAEFIIDPEKLTSQALANTVKQAQSAGAWLLSLQDILEEDQSEFEQMFAQFEAVAIGDELSAELFSDAQSNIEVLEESESLVLDSEEMMRLTQMLESVKLPDIDG